MLMIRDFFVSFALLLFVACTPASPELLDDTLARKNTPSEHLHFQRSYPELAPNISAMNRVMAEVKESASLKSSNHSWTLEGPTNIGGRINTIAIVEDDHDTMYAGSCTGGIFKTSNGGETWIPVSDDFDHLPIAHILINPQDSNDILVATGDPQISGMPHPGNGIYRSFDGGETWEQLGLEMGGVISKLALHPEDPSIIYAGVMGIPYEPSNDRGLYRTTDGGDTWEQVLFIAEDAGVTDLKINPTNPDTLFAAGWNRIRNNQLSLITGPASRIYRSTDGGDTWETLMNGLPQEDLCRIGLEMSANDPSTLWAIIIGQNFETHGIYKTTDSGDNWEQLYTAQSGLLDGALGGFGWYFAKIRVNPWNENEISVLGVDLWTSFDNGANWELTTPEWWTYLVHADKHDMVYLAEDTIILATDGGLYKTDDHFELWNDIDNIPNTQFYRIALDPFNPGFYTGGAQDNGTTTGAEVVINEWERDFGGDGFQAIYDPSADNIRYMETQYGNIVVDDGESISSFTEGIEFDDRRNWDMPYIMSPHSTEVMYTGTQRVYQHLGAPFGIWEPVSQDLTDGDIFGAQFHSISTLAESVTEPGVLYVGTTDANVWKGTQGFNNFIWQPITNDLPERYVTNIKTSRETPGRLWISHSGYKDNDQTAHLHRSDDEGTSWVDVTGDLPEQPVNHIEVLNDSILFIATDHGVYHTINSGTNWERIGNNMPIIPVFDIEIDTLAHTLVAGTFARGIWTFSIDSLFTWPEPVDEPIFVSELPAKGLNLYPNPTEHVLTLTGHRGANLTIYNMQGKMVNSDQVLSDIEVINVSHLRSGKYVMILEKDGITLSAPFLKM